MAHAGFFLVAIGLQADVTLSNQAPPQADAQSVRVSRGQLTTILLRGHQGGGGSLTFRIVQPPEHGKLSRLHLIGDNRAAIAYENDGTELANSDRFRYVVKSNDGRISSPAEVRIVVADVPPKMVVPARIEFDEIKAGESESRSFEITNEGGGMLEGRLSASAPWRLASVDYRVESGRTENISVRFEPDEGRRFVGQITLTGVDGNQITVQLAGAAISPVQAEPDHLEIEPPNDENGPRVGSVALTNQTERALRLKLEASSNIQSIPEITLAPHERKQVSIAVLPECSAPLREDLAFVGNGFKVRLHVDAVARSVAPIISSTNGVSPKLPSAVLSSANSNASMRPNMIASNPITTPVDAMAPSATPPRSNVPSVALEVHRLDASRWELRWPQPKSAVTRYRIEERFVSLDNAGGLQTSWRDIAPIETVALGKEVVANIKGLEAKQRHMVRVTAIGGSGATLWESPVVALTPPDGSLRSHRPWVMLLGLMLLVFLLFRWRSSRAIA